MGSWIYSPPWYSPVYKPFFKQLIRLVIMDLQYIGLHPKLKIICSGVSGLTTGFLYSIWCWRWNTLPFIVDHFMVYNQLWIMDACKFGMRERSFLPIFLLLFLFKSLQWRHNGHDNVSTHQPHDCLLNRLFRCRSKKTSKLRVTGLCAENLPGTGEFPAQTTSNAENFSIWWRGHVILVYIYLFAPTIFHLFYAYFMWWTAFWAFFFFSQICWKVHYIRQPRTLLIVANYDWSCN